MKNIWVPLSGQIAQQRKVETIANNIANANTTGFKKDQLVFKEHLTALSKGMDHIDIPNKEFKPKDFYHSNGGEHAFVKVDGSYTIHEQGPLQPTHNPLDVALKGDGFLEVLTPYGVRYTRKGNLSLSADGELVTAHGYKVLSKSTTEVEEGRAVASATPPETRLIVLPQNEQISISQEGNLYSKQGLIAELSLVEFDDVHALKKQGDSLFIVNDEANIKRNEVATTIHQGFLEGSNVNAIQEMSELIKAHRHFESIQKAINVYDNISNKVSNEIGKF